MREKMNVELFVIGLLSVLYGLTMKMADLHNEHGLKTFRGAPILFGLLWGLVGLALILTDLLLANILLAMNIAFIIRLRLDYLNHVVASSIIIVGFLVFSQLNLTVFLSFYFFFVIFGGLKDLLNDHLNSKNILAKISELMWYYPFSTLLFGLFTNNFLPFFALSLYTLSYNFIKRYYVSLIRGKKMFIEFTPIQ